jgi:hypothetical protein
VVKRRRASLCVTCDVDYTADWVHFQECGAISQTRPQLSTDAVNCKTRTKADATEGTDPSDGPTTAPPFGQSRSDWLET